ncbi:MAG: ABC-F family ATP-binding cassette domain-containing protein [Chloroflexi bacterium]|nr:ABC-F family ATP-binding cassette domain-containing protein [Chloroflexota bacterium]MCH7655612.1 ABC-F family ATP-binding cassette domain-containing protein [Chloroflexota bacterium]
MLFAQNVTKSFGGFDLFTGVSFNVADGERVALVGPNGAGKTTLLRMLAGEDLPTSGHAGHRNGSLGYLKQEAGFDPENTLEQEMWVAFPEQLAITRRLSAIEAELPDAGERATALVAESVDLYERFAMLDGHEVESRVDRVLSGLSFKKTDRTKRCRTFSGGWRMRISLAKVLVRRPDHMLLDEPTNHLDAKARDWLARELHNYLGTLVIVTHDGDFLDRVADRVLEVGSSGVVSYTGNYSKYVVEKEKRRLAQEQAAARQERQLASQQVFIDRFRAKATKATQVKSREKALAKVVRIAPPRRESAAKFSIRSYGRVEQRVLTLDSVSFAFGEELVLMDASLTLERGQKVVLVGPNGSGKSTLLHVAMGQMDPLEGAVLWAERARPGYYEQHQDEALDPRLTVLQEVQAAAAGATEQRVRTVLGEFLFKGDDVFKPISVLSGGERSRVALAKFLIQETNVLLLDEPTNHLDKATRESLVRALDRYDGTILCATHDTAILETIATHVYEMRDGACVNTRIVERDTSAKAQPKKRKK